MAIIVRAKTIALVLLLILGLAFLFFGFAGDNWFKSEPANSERVEGEKDPGTEPVTGEVTEEVTEKVTEKAEVTEVEGREVPAEEIILPKEEIKVSEKITGIEFFAEYRLERDRTRSQQVEILKEIMENSRTGQETREEAQKKLMKMTTNLDKELELENLIRAKNYKDAVVFIQDSSVTVIVLAKDLTDQDTEVLSQLVTRSTGVSRENIVIIPKS